MTVPTFREQCRQLAIRDRHHELLDLLDQAPVEISQFDADLSFWHALCLLSTVRYEEGKIATESFVQQHATPGNALALGRSHLLKSHLCIMEGDTDASYNHELKVVSLLPEDAYHERLRSWSTIDTMAGHIGDASMMERAIDALADVRNHLPFDQSWWYSFVVPNRADILAKRGFLEEAEALLTAQLYSVPKSEVAIIKLRLASLALEHQDPVRASNWLEGIALDGPTTYWSMEAYLIASQVKRLLGDCHGAIQILQEALSENADQMARADFYRAQMQLCELWIQEGEFELAEAWISLASKSLDPWPRTYGHPIPDLIRADLKMAKGNWTEGVQLLETLREEGIRRGHNGLLVGICARLAYAHAACGHPDAAQMFAKCATQAGGNGNFSRSNTVFGIDVRRFLTRTPTAGVHDAHRVVADRRPTLLSSREQEVLRLVEAGHRTTEIAKMLFLSPNTVKNHLSNIYKRLGVNKRRDAVHAARTLGLLPPQHIDNNQT